MTYPRSLCLLAFAALLAPLASALAQGQDRHGAHHSPYAGQAPREIKSLSPEDLAELRRGGGWGMAKAAELNGVPGPAHLLELKDEIPLAPDQVAAVEARFERMRNEAVAAGERLIAGERALELAFRSRAVTPESLRPMLAAIAESRAELRFAHLAAHLAMLDLLSPVQVARYNALRGYAPAGPCAAPPAGHDPAMGHSAHGCD